MADQPSPDIFLSYSRRNKDVMQRVVVFLRNKGLKVWVDNEELTPGTPIWEAEIESAITAAGVTVVLLSPDAKQSEWVRAEVEYAKKNNRRVYPVLVAGDVRTSVPLGLLSHQFVDLRTDEHQGLEELAEAVGAYLGSMRASAEPSPQAGNEDRIDRDTRIENETSTQPLVSPQDQIRAFQQGVEQPAEGEVGQTAWPQSVPEPEEASQKGGNRRPLFWIAGVVAVCVLGACVVGAARIIPGLIGSPATPFPTEALQVTELPTAPEATVAPTEAPPAEPVELTLWHTYESGSVDEDALTNAVDQAASDLQNIHINVIQKPCDGFSDEYSSAVSAGNGPDLVISPCLDLGSAVKAHVIADLTDSASDSLAVYNSNALDVVTLDDRIYGIPQQLYALALWYNKAWLSSPPGNTDELLAMMQAGTPISIGFDCYRIYGFYHAFGGEIFDDNWTAVADQYSGNADALNYLTQVFQIASQNGWPSADQNDAISQFEQGKIAAIITGNWDLQGLRNSLVGDQLGVTTLPDGPSGSSRPILGATAFMLNPYGKNQDVALQAVLYLTSPAIQQMMVEQAGIVPVRTDFDLTDPLVTDLVAVINNGVSPISQNPQFARYWSNFCSTDQVFQGTQSPEEWIQSATAASNQ